MEREPFVIATTERGRIAVSPAAIVQIVGAAAAESYGVVALAGRGRRRRPVALMELDLVRHLARSALQNLEAHRRRIDDLNVYPVPDGDTGTNLVLTLRSIVEALDASTATDSEAVAKDVTRAALMGARGNSGVIFSQIVRGFVEVLGRHEGVSSSLLSRAFRGASDTAYRAVKRPVEGTMLTVIREMAEESERKEHRRLRPPELLRAVLDARRRRPRAHAGAARRPPQRRRGRRGRRGARRDRARHGLRRDGRAASGGAGRGGVARLRRDPSGALAVPVLHGVRRRRRRARQGRARERARGVRRLAARRRRSDRPEDPRAHRRPRTRAGARDRRRRRGGRRDREHAPPDRRSARSACSKARRARLQRSRRGSSPSARAVATAGSSSSSAPRASSRGASR